MNFKTEEDRMKIENVLRVAYKFVPSAIKDILENEGFKVEEQGKDLDLSYKVSGTGDFHAVFYFHNLFLEIATKDRDDDPLEFDEGLSSFGCFMLKSVKVIDSKLRLFTAILKKGPDISGEEIKKIVPEGTRVRVTKLRKGTPENLHDYFSRMQN